ncbi:MAG: FAD-dependent oxidoreductase [Candidatus Aminicenantales bacterium]|jgi:protoporphyrinogen oxidase
MNGQIVIVGAGIAGMTLADRLSEAGVRTVLVECEDRVGGLARSFRYPNNAIFDIGPHRFHTDDPAVQRYIESTLGDNVITIDRNSQLYLFHKYLPWPITLKNVLALPPLMLIRAGFDLLVPRKARTESFEDYIIEKYGRTLYRAFFKPYTEKFLDYTCSNLHRDWAEAGINRATIDKQVKTNSLGALIRSVLFAKNPKTKFLYPKTGGIGTFCEVLADKVKAAGGRILVSTQVQEFVSENDGRIRSLITTSGEEIPTDYVFWSGALDALRALGRAPENIPRLHYVSTVLFNYLVSGRISQKFQWCYFGDADMEVDRISVPRNFNPEIVPPGKEGLCIEVTCTEDSKTWNDPHRFDCVIESFLLHAGLMKSLDQVDDVYVEHIRRTYPLYALNYPRKLGAMFKWVNESWPNLALIGRTGRFWYNNMDHSIAASLQVADRFLADYRHGRLARGPVYAVEDRRLGG